MADESLIYSLRDLAPAGSYWYLASPYSAHPRGIFRAAREACEAAAYLIARGVRLYCPIAHTHSIAICGGLDPGDHDLWLPADRPFIDGACGLIVLMLDGWDKSKGIEFERSCFAQAGKPLIRMAWPRWRHR